MYKLDEMTIREIFSSIASSTGNFINLLLDTNIFALIFYGTFFIGAPFYFYRVFRIKNIGSYIVGSILFLVWIYFLYIVYKAL